MADKIDKQRICREGKIVEGLKLLMEDCLKRKGEANRRDDVDEFIVAFNMFDNAYKIAKKLDYFPKKDRLDLRRRYFAPYRPPVED